MPHRGALTIALLTADGRELGKRTWQSLTIGNDKGASLIFGSRTKSPGLEVEMAEKNFLELFADGQRPVIRVVLEVVPDKDDD